MTDEKNIPASSPKEEAPNPTEAVSESTPASKEEQTEVVAAPKPTRKEEPKEVTAQTKRVPTPKGEPKDGHWWWGLGRRKAAVARVRIRPGTGTFIVNDRELTNFFTEIRDHNDIMRVMEKTNTKGSIDVFVNTNGGGYTGQAGAIILGLGRALTKYDPALESILRSNGYLTRDPRIVERKKPGQPGARKRFQFSKR